MKLDEWTPAWQREHRKRFPSTWTETERKIKHARRMARLRFDKQRHDAVTLKALRARRGEPEPVPVIKVDVAKDQTVTSADKIIQLCAEFAGFTVVEMKSPRRARKLVAARQAAIFLILRHCDHFSLPMIGRKFGGRDHSTILHAKYRVANDLAAEGKCFLPFIEHVERNLVDCVEQVDSGDDGLNEAT